MLFKDPILQQQFNLNGYVILPFLTAAQVAQLRQLFFDTHPQIPDGFYSSSFHDDQQHKQYINEQIETLLSNPVAATFGEIRKLGSCFLNKQPGVQSEMPIHQDWTIVNEPTFDSVTIWIPLQDVNAENGSIQVVDGSHRFSTALRAPSMEDPFKNIQDLVRKDLQQLTLSAGEAFIFSHALLHASPPNCSNQPRIAVTYGLVEKEAALFFYHKNDEGKVEQYAVADNFFQTYNTRIGQRPEHNELMRTVDYQPQPVSASEYLKAKQNYLNKKAQAMYRMIPIFKDQKIQSSFEQEGYAVLPLLSPEEVEDLTSYYFSLNLKDEKGYGFHVSMDQQNKEMCRAIREKVWSVALPRLNEHLKDFKPFVASYVVKEVNPKGVVPAHQDWSFTADEEKGFCSITCWIALVDTHLDNGGMGVIKGSHKFMMNHRPSPSPQCPVPLSEHMFSIFPYLHTLDIKAGEVLFFDNRTFHASPPNTSDGIRLAVGVGVTQKDARLVHYYMKPDGSFNTMLRYNVDEDFYLRYENATLARMYDAGQLIEGYGTPTEVPYAYTKYASEELITLIKDAGNTFNVPMTEKLAKLFGYLQDGTKKEEPVAEQKEEKKEEVIVETKEVKWIDTRPIYIKYSPLNIAREIKKRITGQ